MLGEQEKEIKVGDLVIAYINPNAMNALIMEKDGILNNRHGSFCHSDMIGKPFGSKIASSSKQGYVFVLFPTPELWTLVLNHRTQILYMADIAFIGMKLGIRPGCNIIEAGTGSGSFSHCIARSIAPSGKLFTFEYHAERQKQAMKEFSEHRIDSVVSSYHRDVCKDGFDISILGNSVSAVFLDLPSPWEAINHKSFKGVFQKDRIGRICCFSPCIEQVQLTCKSLKTNGFTQIEMFEVLIREHDVKNVVIQSIPTTKSQVMALSASKKRKAGPEEAEEDKIVSSEKVLMSCLNHKAKGHTSFLTFATLVPADESPIAAIAAWEE